jgi:hypothetical protein
MIANPIHPTALNYAIQLAFNDNDVARAIALVKIHHANYYMEKDHFALLKRFFEMFDDKRGRNELLALYTSPMALAARSPHGVENPYHIHYSIYSYLFDNEYRDMKNVILGY